MKIQITFKADAQEVLETVYDAVDMDADHCECLLKELKKWIKNGESVTIEFDTVKNTAKVIPRKTRKK